MVRLQIIGVAIGLAASCSVPPEPAAIKTSNAGESPSAAKKAGTTSSAGALVDFGGALVGDATLQATVKTCLDQGKFYERRANGSQGCTSFALAQVVCKYPAIKNHMSATQASQFGSLVDTQLPGYLLDQCIDCTTPAGNSYCLGQAQTIAPGMRLFFVKESGAEITITTVYIPKE